MATTTRGPRLGNPHRADVGVVLLSGCSDSSTPDPDAGERSTSSLSPDDPDAFAATDTLFDSGYCATSREWAVHELDGSADGAYSENGPEGLKTWWNEQLAYLATSISPPPADVRFAPGPGPKAYCKAVRAQERGLPPGRSGQVRPRCLRAYATSTSFLEALDAQDAAAPPEIAADVSEVCGVA